MTAVATKRTANRPSVRENETASPYRWSVESYDAMIRAGILGPDDKVELIRGEVVEKMPKGDRHSHAVSVLNQELVLMLGRAFFVRPESPVALPDSELEPDFCIARGRASDYNGRKPDASETPIIIEVSDSSLSRDRCEKQSIYAEAGFANYWIVNLIHRIVECYSKPFETEEDYHYTECETYAVGQSVPVVLDGTAVGAIPVADLMTPE